MILDLSDVNDDVDVNVDSKPFFLILNCPSVLMMICLNMDGGRKKKRFVAKYKRRKSP